MWKLDMRYIGQRLWGVGDGIWWEVGCKIWAMECMMGIWREIGCRVWEVGSKVWAMGYSGMWEVGCKI